MSATMGSDLWQEQQADATPTMDEQIAEWRDVPASEVTEDMRMRWLDWVRA